MRQITCIICPIGCRLTININGKVFINGNKCQKGADFAMTELTSPVRSLTTTLRTIFPEVPVLPVKTKGEVPKAKIYDIMKALSSVIIIKKTEIGDIVVKNILDTGCDIVAAGEVIPDETADDDIYADET